MHTVMKVPLHDRNPVITAAKSLGREMQRTAVFATNYLCDWEKITFLFLGLLTCIKKRTKSGHKTIWFHHSDTNLFSCSHSMVITLLKRNPEVIICFVLEIRDLRYTEVKWLTQGHVSIKFKAKIQVSALPGDLFPPLSTILKPPCKTQAHTPHTHTI